MRAPRRRCTTWVARPESASRPARRRRGVILLAVLIALVLLSLAGYQYADLMQSEYRAASNAHRTMQARAIAESGVYYTAALLATPTNVNSVLNGNIGNNPQYFMAVQVPTADGNGQFGKFTLVAPPDPLGQSSGEYAYGVVDECAKLNINVLMQLDPTGATLYNALMMLPNMTTGIAYSIVDWVDMDNNVSPGGAEEDYYSALSPSYHCKNGPLESLEELLLVQGVTSQLLFGDDLNRNGVIDASELPGQNLGLGWQQFLTVASREANSDASGNPYLYLNTPDLEGLYNALAPIDPGLANFVVLYRQYGGSSSGGGGSGNSSGASGSNSSTSSSGANSGSSAGSGAPSNAASASVDVTQPPQTNITSMWSLVNATVTVPGTNGQPSTTVTSPLGDPSLQTNLLPKFFSTCTLSPSNEIPARININTCPQEVLYALQGILNPSLVTAATGNTGGTTGGSSSSSSSTSSSSSSTSSTATAQYLQDTDIQTILSTRPSFTGGSAPDPSFQSVAWLYLQANLSLNTLQMLEPFITARSQVYRVQSIGYIDDKGPAVRIEAIIDTNGGRPRITRWRDLTTLGKGWDGPQ